MKMIFLIKDRECETIWLSGIWIWGYSGKSVCINGHIVILKKFLLFCWQLVCGCRVFNNYKNSNYKKLRRNQQKFEIFFVKFQAPFSQKIINIHLYISYKACIHSIVWLWWPPNDIYFNNQSPHWKTFLFVETTKLFISNSVRVYRYICEIFLLYVPGVGLLTPCFVPRGGFLYTMIVPGGRVFAPLEACPGFVPGRGNGFGWNW